MMTTTRSAAPRPPQGILAAAAVSMAMYRVARSLGGVVRSRRVSRLAGAAAGAYFAYAAYRALVAAASAREHERRVEDSLDARLDDSFPASDAVASY